MHSSPGRNTHPSPDKLAENVLTPHRICNHNDADEAANKNSATVFSSHSSSLKQFSSSEASSPQSPPPFPSSISSSHVCNSESGHTNQLPPIPTSIAGPKRKSIKKRIRNMFTKRSSSPLHGNNSSHHAGNEQINIKNLSKNSNNSNPNHPNHNNRNAKDAMAKNNSTRTRTRSRIYNKRKHKTMKRHPNIASVSDLKSLGTIDLNHDDDQIEESQSSIISIFDDLDVFHTTRCSSYTSLEIDSLKELSASSDALSCSGISSGSTLLPDTSVSSNASNSTIIDPAFNRRRCTSAGNSRAVNPLSSLTLRSSTLTKHDKDQNSLERCRKAKFNDGDSSNINFNNGGVKIDGMDNDHYINDVSGKLSNNCVLLEQESNRGDDCSVHDSKQCHDHNDVGDTSDSGSAINASPDTASCPAPSNTERTGTMITTDINAAVAIPEDLNDLDAIPSYDTLNAHVSSLYHEGKELFYQGQYDKAYRVQLEALVAISDHHESSKSTTSSLLPNQGDDNIKEEHSDSNIMKTHGTNSSFDRLDAMIRYELANIQYVAIRENTTLFDADPSIEADSKASSECHDNTLALSRLHDQVEDAKCRIAAVNYQYYRRELKVVEQSSDSSDWNQIYNKLFILHNLGKLCDQDFHLYDDALRYYERALSIEESLLDTLKNSKTLPSRSDDAIEKNDSKKCEFDWDVKEFTHRVRMTKKKIGSIYYTSGRFDLALLSSFSS